MRRLSLALVLSILAAVCGARLVRADQVRAPVEPFSGSRFDRVARWLEAVEQHLPGIEDEAVLEVVSWSNDDLRMLWIDVNIVVQLMRSPRGATFRVRAEGASAASTIRYTAPQLQQLKTLACAAGGDEHCVAIDAAAARDDGLVRVASAAHAARLRGDDNYVVRRGALLHLDAAMLPARAPLEPISTVSSLGPRMFRLQVSDGRQVDSGMGAVHLEIARMVLDFVKPPGADRVAPGRDPMVRAWYRATAAWMAHREDHDLLHLERGRAMFPDDPDLLFLSGCQRETFAAPHIQAAVHSASLPSGYSIGVESERGELQRAETFFRRALDPTSAKPACAGAGYWGSLDAIPTPRESFVRQWPRSTRTSSVTSPSCFSAQRKSRSGSTTRRSMATTGRPRCTRPRSRRGWR
jgi:hypothetical protein